MNWIAVIVFLASFGLAVVALDKLYGVLYDYWRDRKNSRKWEL